MTSPAETLKMIGDMDRLKAENASLLSALETAQALLEDPGFVELHYGVGHDVSLALLVEAVRRKVAAALTSALSNQK